MNILHRSVTTKAYQEKQTILTGINLRRLCSSAERHLYAVNRPRRASTVGYLFEFYCEFVCRKSEGNNA